MTGQYLHSLKTYIHNADTQFFFPSYLFPDTLHFF